MKTAFMFSGQGAEKLGMGKDLYDNYPIVKDIFLKANEVLGYDLTKICFENENELKKTSNSQPALLTTSYSIFSLLKSKGICADYHFGLSLGEYSALVASNAFSFEEGLLLVNKRGLLMENAFVGLDCGMYAILKTPVNVIESTINSCKHLGIIEIANFNTPNQIIISGEIEPLEKAISILKEQKYKSIKLKVNGAFHTSLLETASLELNKELNKLNLHNLDVPVISNVNADFITDSEIVDLLTLQIKSQVKFYQSVEKLIDCGVTTFVELGVSKTLASFIKKINKDVKVFHIEDLKSLNFYLESLEVENV